MGITCENNAEKITSILLMWLTMTMSLQCVICNGELNASRPKRTSNFNADFIIGGLFPVHVHEKDISKCDRRESAWYRYMETAMGNIECYRMNVFGLMWVEAMLFAITEINNRVDILPNVTIGYDIRDGANNVHNALNASLDFILPHPSQDTLHKQNITNLDRCTCAIRKTGKVNKIIAVVGGAGSRISKAVNTILSIDSIPQISYSSTSPSLSDKNYFPSFLRTIPPDYIQAQVMADLVSHYEWTFVSTVATDEDYGRLGIEAFKQEVKSRNVCISVDELFHPNNNLASTKAAIQRIVTKLKNDQRSSVIVLFCESPNALAVLEEAERQGLTGKTWIGTEAWGDKTTVLPFKNATVGGMLGVLPWKGSIGLFEKHMAELNPRDTGHNPWFEEYWQGKFGCEYTAKSAPNKSAPNSGASCANKTANFSCENSTNSTLGTEVLQCLQYEGKGLPTAAGIQLNKAPNVMDSVYAIAWALHKALNCTTGLGPTQPGTCYNRDRQFTPKELLGYIKTLSFTGKLGYPVQFDRYGDTKGNYLIKSLQPDSSSPYGHSFATIGYWSWMERKLVLTNDTITWNSGTTRVPYSRCSAPCSRGEYPVQGGVRCCWTCVKCPKGFIKNISGPGDCVKCDKGFSSDRSNSECLKLPEIYFRWDSAMSIVVLVLSSAGLVLTVFVICVFLRYRSTAVVKASTREFSGLMLIIIAFMFLLTTLYIGRPTNTMCKVRPFCFGFVITFWTSLMLTKTNRLLLIFKNKRVAMHDIILGVRFQLVLAMFLTLISIATALAWMILFPPEVTSHYFDTRVAVDCGNESRTLLIILLGYTAVLAAITTFLAYKARNLPENFNETRYIGFSMFTFCVIWFTFIPLYLSTDPAVKYIFLCFALDVTGLCTLLCMFASRLRIIIFHPEQNRTEVVRANMLNYTLRDRVGSAAAASATARQLRRTSVVTVGNFTLSPGLE